MEPKVEGGMVWGKQSSCEQGFRHPYPFQLQELSSVPVS